MFRMEALNIDLLAQQEDSFETTYILHDEYFRCLDNASVKQGNICVDVRLTKVASSEYDLHLGVSGEVVVPCDRCLDDMMLAVNANSMYRVKLGCESGDNEDVLMVDERDGILSLAWVVYETIALAIPIRHVHESGECNEEMIRKLDELSSSESKEECGDSEVDSRWAELAKLKN